MFEAFKAFGPLSYKKLAGFILSDRPIFEGRSPRSRIEDKTWVSRYVVNAPLGTTHEAYFDDFGKSARAVLSYLKSKQGPGHSTESIVEHFGAGELPHTMKQALDAHNQGGSIYLNVLQRVLHMNNVSQADTAELVLLHFIATGCLNNARKSADLTLEYAQNNLSMSFKTTLPKVSEPADEVENEDVYLCLVRVRNGRLLGQPFYLNPGSEGTEIGSLATKAYSITDVEETVSGRHLLIWRGDDGTWLAEGLNSKNGTYLISGADRSKTVIEPPRNERGNFEPSPVKLQAGDELVLGHDTVFMIMESASF